MRGLLSLPSLVWSCRESLRSNGYGVVWSISMCGASRTSKPDHIQIDRAVTHLGVALVIHFSAPSFYERIDVRALELVQPQLSQMFCPSTQDCLFLFYGCGRL